MNAERLLKHFDEISDAPDAVLRLRRFILDLAVRGKLVEQDPNDEPALELLKRIEAEKARLVQVGEIKKSRIISPIDNGNALFSLPDSWLWVKLGAVFAYDAGEKTAPNQLPEDSWLLELEDIEKNSGRVLQRLNVHDRSPKSTKSGFKMGDVLYGKLRPYLNKAVVADRPGFSTTEIVALRCYGDSAPRYTALALRRPDFVEYVTRCGQGTKMPRLRTEDAIKAFYPLPPLAEQHRIVAKVDELMALCDELETAQSQRETRRDRLVASSLHRLNNGDADPEPDGQPTFKESARFYFNHLPKLTVRPEHIKQLRQTILDLAVRGKLVEQDSRDEAAAKLLVQIQAELWQDRGQKKASFAGAPQVDESRQSFDVPPGWSRARFPQLGILGRGKSKHRPRNDSALFEGGTHLLVQTGDVARSSGLIKTYTSKYNEVGLKQSFKWPKGTLCITIAANIADSGILGFDACFPDSVVGFVPASVFPNARYFEYFVRTVKNRLLEFAPATAQKNINLETLNEILIPLPPLAEQHRIVAKVDELMGLCDELGAGITANMAVNRLLLEVTLLTI